MFFGNIVIVGGCECAVVDIVFGMCWICAYTANKLADSFVKEPPSGSVTVKEWVLTEKLLVKVLGACEMNQQSVGSLEFLISISSYLIEWKLGMSHYFL